MCGHAVVLQSSLSKALSSSTTPKQLQKVHSLIIISGLEKSAFFSGKLISKYAQLKDPISSLSVFHQNSPTTTIYLWNSIIRSLTQNGLFSKALHFYSQLGKFGLKPDAFTFPSVINACAASLDFEMGRCVHDRVLEMGFGFDLYIGNSLVDMYSRFGDLVKARNVFEVMPHKDRVSWNSLISGYSANGYWEEALDIYYQLRMSGLKPDSFTVSSVLPACEGLLAFQESKVIHGLIEKIGIGSDVLVSNGLLSAYFKFGAVMEARRVFDEMVIRDNVSWNTLICGYSRMGLLQETVKLFMEMVRSFRPDLLTITSVLRACGHLQDLKFGNFVHDYMIRNGFVCDVVANNILIDTYVRCGDLLASQKVFNSMKWRDTVSWNSLINGYIQGHLYDEGAKLFKLMKADSKPDFITYLSLLSMSAMVANVDLGKEIHCELAKLGFDLYLTVGNALVDMYSKCGKMDDSLKAFEIMKFHDVVSWNTIIAACVQFEDCSLGFRMINRMSIEGVVPDKSTILGILPICSLLAAKWQGKEVHGFIFKLGIESTVAIGNALIEMYSKCGNLGNSIRVFECMEAKDVVTWTALISAYGMYGDGKRALRAFEEMEAAGIVPDHVAFIAIIFACSHSGLVEEGLACFDRMKKDYNIEPRIEHYACVVDLLSRSRLLHKAEEFISSMPLKPDASIWGALLSACRASGDMKIAELAVQNLMHLDSDNTGYYVLVSNVYAASRKWDQVRTMRKLIKERGLRKDAGRSWIEIRKRVYAFGTGDTFCEMYEEVNKLLGKLAGLMAKEGYVTDLQCALHDVEEDEKRDLLCGHSERLAIAFGLLNTEPGASLQVMKNLRVCGDCHTWTKYVSKIAQREILVRDANRFHLFKEGSCSCGDHW